MNDEQNSSQQHSARPERVVIEKSQSNAESMKVVAQIAQQQQSSDQQGKKAQ